MSKPYFAPGYFASLGGPSGPGYSPGITFPSEGGFFPGRYFAPTYFAPTYFPAHPPPSLPVIPSFVAAVRVWLRDNAPIMARMPGDWWNRQIPRGNPEPAGFYLVTQSTDEQVGGRKYIRTGKLQLSVYAPESATARDLADRSIRFLADAPLMWTRGRIMYLRPSDPSSPAPANPGAGGAAVQGENRVLDFQYHGEY